MEVYRSRQIRRKEIFLTVDKTSINVHVYNPPEYIISVRAITHYNGGSKENIEYETVYRYRYDYDSRKMYKEDKDDNGVVSWKLIDPAASKSYHDDNWVALGEIMFYLAYNMSFYDSPIVAKQFINEGRSGLPLVDLPNGGTAQYGTIIIIKQNNLNGGSTHMINEQRKTILSE